MSAYEVQIRAIYAPEISVEPQVVDTVSLKPSGE
jgi:hypothetical protein